MKKYISITLVALMITGIMVSCIKDPNPDRIDYTASIKDKTWWGMVTYTGKTPEYYSVHFNADNSLLWSQLSGDYPGQWIINDKQIIMNFPGIASIVKAEISDGKLMNFSDDNNSFTINTGQLVPNPTIPLGNTVWSMILGGLPGYEMIFTPGSKVEIRQGSLVFGPYSYKRLPSGAGIKVDLGGSLLFGVVISEGEMKGSRVNSEIPWHAVRI
ncbi:MAG: hypothetical protein ABIR18_12150 [Chitinophagaceae bacterium]